MFARSLQKIEMSEHTTKKHSASTVDHRAGTILLTEKHGKHKTVYLIPVQAICAVTKVSKKPRACEITAHWNPQGGPPAYFRRRVDESMRAVMDHVMQALDASTPALSMPAPSRGAAGPRAL
jgi:hypothetical protein